MATVFTCTGSQSETTFGVLSIGNLAVKSGLIIKKINATQAIKINDLFNYSGTVTDLSTIVEEVPTTAVVRNVISSNFNYVSA